MNKSYKHHVKRNLPLKQRKGKGALKRRVAKIARRIERRKKLPNG